MAFMLGGYRKSVPRRTEFLADDMWKVAFGSSAFEEIDEKTYFRIRFGFFVLSFWILIVSLVRTIVLIQWPIYFSHWLVTVAFVYFTVAAIAAKLAIEPETVEEAEASESSAEKSAAVQKKPVKEISREEPVSRRPDPPIREQRVDPILEQRQNPIQQAQRPSGSRRKSSRKFGSEGAVPRGSSTMGDGNPNDR